MRHRCAAPAAAGRDAGSLTLMLAVLMVALLALAGLVIDGGRKLNQSASAYAVAQEAARAGAGFSRAVPPEWEAWEWERSPARSSFPSGPA